MIFLVKGTGISNLTSLLPSVNLGGARISHPKVIPNMLSIGRLVNG